MTKAELEKQVKQLKRKVTSLEKKLKRVKVANGVLWDHLCEIKGIGKHDGS